MKRLLFKFWVRLHLMKENVLICCNWLNANVILRVCKYFPTTITTLTYSNLSWNSGILGTPFLLSFSFVLKKICLRLCVWLWTLIAWQQHKRRKSSLLMRKNIFVKEFYAEKLVVVQWQLKQSKVDDIFLPFMLVTKKDAQLTWWRINGKNGKHRQLHEAH